MPEKVERKLYSAYLLVILTIVTEADRVRLSEVRRCRMLSSPKERSNRLRGAMREGLWSSFSALGAVRVSSDEVNCETGQIPLAMACVGVARMPLQAKPAWASWSAVSGMPLESFR